MLILKFGNLILRAKLLYQSVKWPSHPFEVGHVTFFIQELAYAFTRRVTKPEAHFTEVCLVLEYTSVIH